MKHKEFWRLTSSGGVVTSKRDPRWLVGVDNLTVPIRADLLDRKVKLTEVPGLFGETCGEFYREQDLVMTLSELIYSERVKALFEKECPGNAEFAPIEIRGTPVPLKQKYYLVHAVYAIDCIIKETAYVMPGRDGPYYARFEVDPSKVPEHIKFFALNDGTYRHVIRDSLRRSMMRAKLLGAQYFST